MSLIELCGVRKVYRAAGDDVVALDDVSLRVEPGEVVLLVGPSGSGKTTLLSVMGCILRPCEGKVLVGGVDAARLSEEKLPGLRARHFGYVFQQYNLFQALTARENVEAALEMKFGRVPRAGAEADRLLDLVGLASRSGHKPRALSGGQCQRVSIARALAGNPPIILADEPTAALDAENALQVMDLLRRLAREGGRTVVLISHDHRLEEYTDRTLRLEGGRLSASAGACGPRQSSPQTSVDINVRAPLNGGGRRKREPGGEGRGIRPHPRGESLAPLYPLRAASERPGSIPQEEPVNAPPGSTSRSLSMRSHACSMASPMAHRSSSRVVVLAATVLLSVAAGCGVYATANRRATGASGAGPLDGSAAAARATRLIALGLVEARRGTINLSVAAPGVLAKIYVDEGEWFEKDRLLAELANDELAARVEMVRQDLAQAQAGLALLLAGPRKPQVDEARAELGASAADAAHVQRMQRMQERLLTRNAVAAAEVLDVQARAEIARKRHEAADARLQLLLAGARPEEIAMAHATVRLSQARLSEAIAAFDRTQLKAASAGRVLRVLHREGEAVAGNDASPVLLVADTRQLQVRAEVEQSQAASLRVGMPVTASAPGLPDRTYKGKITRILDMMGRKQIHTDDPFEKVDYRVLEVIVSLEDAGQLRINQRVDVVIGAAADVQETPVIRKSGHELATRFGSVVGAVSSFLKPNWCPIGGAN
jgi:putative ABC transport system ATP-binding protein